MLGGSELSKPHPTPMLSLLLSCLLELLIAHRQQYEIYNEEPVLSPSEADTPASLPSHLHGTTTLSQYRKHGGRGVGTSEHFLTFDLFCTDFCSRWAGGRVSHYPVGAALRSSG